MRVASLHDGALGKAMNTHRNVLTPTEEELNDEQVLKDIQRRMGAATIPQEFDARALAARAVGQYWADRERGVIDREGRPVSDIILANRVAIRRLRDDEHGGQVMNFLAVALPPLVAIVVWMLFPSLLNTGGRVFRQPGFVTGGVVLLLLVVVVIAVVDQKLRDKWLEEGKLSRHTVMGFVVGGLLAATVSLAIGQQTENARQRVAQAQAARQRAEEEKRRAEEAFWSFSSKSARQEIIELASDKMQEQLKGGHDKNSNPVELPVGDKRIKVTRKPDSSNNVVYRAEGAPLPEPVEITLNKESGLLKTEGSSEEKLRFYAAVVKDISGNTLTLKVKDQDGRESELTWSSPLKFQPKQEQVLFVVVDPKTNEPTDVTEFKPDVKKEETSRPR